MYVTVGPYSQRAKTLLISGLLLRVVGGLVYLFVIGSVYGGGDYQLYFDLGRLQVQAIDFGQWQNAWNSYSRLSGSPLGTQVVINVTALLQYLFDTSLVELFILFSIVGYAGCALMARATRTLFGQQAYERYLALIMLYPSLWFWPSALGKDGLILFGIGMVAVGIARTGGLARWAWLLAGMAVVFFVRPGQAAVLGFSVAVAYVFASTDVWTAGRIVQAVGGLAVLAVSLVVVGDAVGFSLVDVDSLNEFVSRRADVTAYGGSSFALSGPVWLLPVSAFATVLFRPFPWESGGVTALVTSLEVVALWAFVWMRRSSVVAMFRRSPHSTLFWMGIAFLVLYGTLLGLSVGNFGTLVRQRVHIYPFLFLFLMLKPAARRIVRRPAVRVRPSEPLPV